MKAIVGTHEIFAAYRDFMQTLPSNRADIVKKLCHKVQLLMEHVSFDRFNALRLSLERTIAECQAEFEVSGKVSIGKGRKIELDEFFQLLRPIFILQFHKETENLRSLMQIEAGQSDPDRPGFPASPAELGEALLHKLGEESAVPARASAYAK